MRLTTKRFMGLRSPTENEVFAHGVYLSPRWEKARIGVQEEIKDHPYLSIPIKRKEGDRFAPQFSLWPHLLMARRTRRVDTFFSSCSLRPPRLCGEITFPRSDSCV